MKNVIQNYPWGSTEAIADLLGQQNLKDVHQAELWMGSHSRGSSRIQLIDGREISLEELLKYEGASQLGDILNDQFHNLPFLFKVLAAEKPLSIQVHPNKIQAEEGFKRENDASIAIEAFNRNYRDNNHKPEIICALTPFWALRGFRPINQIVQIFKRLKMKSFETIIEKLSLNRTEEGLKTFFIDLMNLKGNSKESFINELLEVCGQIEEDIFQWVGKLHNEYKNDVSICAPLYLNLICLKPGQALYLPSGVLHAYLHGLGMELMASSDNVLRGGLTPKYMDLDELKKIVNFKGDDINIIEAKHEGGTIYKYLTSSKEFELSRIDLNEKNDYIIGEGNSVQIIFISEGIGLFHSNDEKSIHCKKGDSFYIPQNAGIWILEGKATLYRATVPGE